MKEKITPYPKIAFKCAKVRWWSPKCWKCRFRGRKVRRDIDNIIWNQIEYYSYLHGKELEKKLKSL